MNKSFSQAAKNEICTVSVKNKCCRCSVLYGILYGAAEFSADRILLESENPNIAALYGRLIHDITDINTRNVSVLLDCSDKETIKKITDALHIEAGKKINNGIMVCESCKWAFVKGVFLSCGTVTAPDNAYHMEFLFREYEAASEFAHFMCGLTGTPKITERRDSYGVYYKNSENVVDILGQIGASNATFKLLEVKIIRDLRNNINRASNCDIANLSKTLNASGEQMRAIEIIIESGRADELPDELRETFDLRAAYPDDTLSELAARHEPCLTKSGVNHRLKRIVEFSRKL